MNERLHSSTSHTSSRIVLLGVLLVVAGAATAQAGWWSDDDHLLPSEEQQGLEHLSVDAASARVVDTADTGSGATWEFVTYNSTSGTCLDAIGHTRNGARVMLGGCGDFTLLAPTLTSYWNVGRVNLDGQDHTVVFGLASPSASQVRLVFADGSAVMVLIKGSGLWFFDTVFQSGEAPTVIRLEAIDAAGAVEEEVIVPSVPAAEHDESGEPHSH